jgi:hypothetical protein
MRDLANDVEAEPEPGSVLLAAFEGLEDFRKHLSWYRRPVVVNGDLDLLTARVRQPRDELVHVVSP